MIDIKGYQVAIGAAIGLLGSLGFQVMSPGQQMEQHRAEHVQLETTLEAIQEGLEGIDTNLALLIRVRCLEMDSRDIELAGLDCS